MTFAYVAKVADGRTVSGSLEAPSPKAVVEALHRQGLVILKVQAAKVPARLLRKKKVRLDDLAIFARQMATLVDAGIPLVGGLEAVADQMENPLLKEVVAKVRLSVEEGMSFSAAIAKQSNIFSRLFVNMVRAGEASGHLAEVLERLAGYLEKSAALQRKVKSALVYPAIVFAMAIAITSLLMLKVIPAFKDIFLNLGVALPLPTRLLIAVSDLAQRGFLPGLGLGMMGLFFFRRWVATPMGRLKLDRMLLKLKIVGNIVRKVSIAKFARTLSTLIKSGVPILSALEIVADTAGNRVVAEAVLRVRSSIREGENISDPLAVSGVFPPLVIRMIAVGEQTGRLDDMLTKIAEFYEEQVDAAIQGLTSAIEPLIIGILGLVVGSIVAAIFMPIFKITQVLAR